jgi:hypothetical protein
MDPNEKMFADLPESIREMAAKLAVKEMTAAHTSRKLNAATDEMTRLREELQSQIEEADQLKVDLREACKNHTKEKNT